MEWAILPFRRYSVSAGRSRRKEFWAFQLLMLVLTIATGLLDELFGWSGMFGLYGPLTLVALLATVTPSFTVAIRRLHDTSRSGWWLLVGLVASAALFLLYVLVDQGRAEWAWWPLIGVAAIAFLVLIYFFLLDGTADANEYGPDPKEGERAPAARIA